nr:pseudouridine synthase [Corynebacterium tapiri]
MDHRQRISRPLPIVNGLNPSRARPDVDTTAGEFLTALIDAQRHRHPEDNHIAIQRRFENGEVVDSRGNRLSFISPLNAGQDMWFYRIPAPEVPVPYEIQTVYEDDRILVVSKPPFLATMPRAQHITETATVRLRRSTGNNELSPAHRLDRLTSGLLLFTKAQQFRGAYQTLFAQRQASKTYVAVARYSEDLATQAPLWWRNRIEKTPGQFQARTGEGPVNAETLLHNVQRLEPEVESRLQQVHNTHGTLGLYTLKPATGKTHQLRLHMHLAGAPILGDNGYPTPLPPEAEDYSVPLRLCATQLEFTDPVDGTARHFTLPETSVFAI